MSKLVSSGVCTASLTVVSRPVLQPSSLVLSSCHGITFRALLRASPKCTSLPPKLPGASDSEPCLPAWDMRTKNKKTDCSEANVLEWACSTKSFGNTCGQGSSRFRKSARPNARGIYVRRQRHRGARCWGHATEARPKTWARDHDCFLSARDNMSEPINTKPAPPRAAVKISQRLVGSIRKSAHGTARINVCRNLQSKRRIEGRFGVVLRSGSISRVVEVRRVSRRTQLF